MTSEHSNTRSPSTRSLRDLRIIMNLATRSFVSATPRLKRFSLHTMPAGLCRCRAAMEKRRSNNCNGTRLKRVPVSYHATANAAHPGSYSTQVRGVSKLRKSTYEPWQLSGGRIRETPFCKDRWFIRAMRLRCNRRTITSEQ